VSRGAVRCIVSTLSLPAIPAKAQNLALHTQAPIEQAKALHPAFYIDEEYATAERERIFGTQWFAVGHTAELANPGDVKVVDVGNQSIILTCDKKNEASCIL